MQEITYNSSENCNQITIPLAATLEREAEAGLDEWFEPIAKNIAVIAEAPEYAKVAALEKRRAEAEGRIAAMEARIEEIKRTCASHVLDDAKAIAAAREIEDCQRSIAAQRLALDSVAAVLPTAIEARQEATQEALSKLLRKPIDEVGEERSAIEEGIREAVRSGYRRLVNARRRGETLHSWLGKKPEDVLACAQHCGADKKDR